MPLCCSAYSNRYVKFVKYDIVELAVKKGGVQVEIQQMTKKLKTKQRELKEITVTPALLTNEVAALQESLEQKKKMLEAKAASSDPGNKKG